MSTGVVSASGEMENEQRTKNKDDHAGVHNWMEKFGGGAGWRK